MIGDGDILAQNWDWHPDLQESTLLWIVREHGGWFATLTEAGMLAKIGINDAGLGVCLNLLRCSEDGGLDGTPIHLLMRRTLACRSVAEAVALLTSTRVSASSAVTVATPGVLGTVELSPGGARLVRGGTHTNHFLKPPRAGTDVIESESSRPRLDAIRSLPLREALRSHPVCRHVDESEPWEERTATLASVIMHLASAPAGIGRRSAVQRAVRGDRPRGLAQLARGVRGGGDHAQPRRAGRDRRRADRLGERRPARAPRRSAPAPSSGVAEDAAGRSACR